MIKAVFLDVGGVVLKIDWANPLKYLNIPIDRQAEVVENLKAWPVFHRFEEGRASAEEFFAGINDLLGVNASLEDLRQAWLSLIVGDLPGNQLLFEWLERKSVPRFALSNTNSVHDEYQQRHFPILKRFDHFYKSFELGHRKPGIEIFQLAAKHAGFAPHECLFIDDTPENVEGARGAGWKAHLSIDDVSLSLDLFQREIG